MNRSLLVWLGLALAVLLLAALGVATNLDDILAAFRRGGLGLLWLCLLQPIQVLPMAEAWRLLYLPAERPRHLPLWLAMWIGQALNLLIPTGTLGGEVVKARLAVRAGSPPAAAVATVIADKTLQAIQILILVLIGAALLAAHAAKPALTYASLGLACAMALGIVGFIALQRSGRASRTLERLARDPNGLIARTGAGTRKVEAELEAIYAPRLALPAALALRVGAAIALSLEVWLAAKLMGVPIGLGEAVMLRVLGFAVRSAAFFVVGGLGVQEATYAVLAAVLGLEPASLIALSLATRVREVLASLPAIAIWLFGEVRTSAKHGAHD